MTTPITTSDPAFATAAHAAIEILDAIAYHLPHDTDHTTDGGRQYLILDLAAQANLVSQQGQLLVGPREVPEERPADSQVGDLPAAYDALCENSSVLDGFEVQKFISDVGGVLSGVKRLGYLT